MTKHRSTNKYASTARYPRTARINEVLREVIATELEKHSDEDDRLELVTVTGVEIDTDLRRAKVYFSALDTTATVEEVQAALKVANQRLGHRPTARLAEFTRRLAHHRQ